MGFELLVPSYTAPFNPRSLLPKITVKVMCAFDIHRRPCDMESTAFRYDNWHGGSNCFEDDAVSEALPEMC